MRSTFNACLFNSFFFVFFFSFSPVFLVFIDLCWGHCDHKEHTHSHILHSIDLNKCKVMIACVSRSINTHVFEYVYFQFIIQFVQFFSSSIISNYAELCVCFFLFFKPRCVFRWGAEGFNIQILQQQGKFPPSMDCKIPLIALRTKKGYEHSLYVRFD